MPKKTLRQLRRERDITQEELARRVGITPRTIVSFETDVNNLRRTSYMTVEKLAKALNIEVADIFLG